MGRRSLSVPRKRVNLYIEEGLLARFALLHFDPTRGAAEYGKLSEAVNTLLRADLDRIDLERRQAGMTCEDEGCPHYGTPHAHPEELQNA